MCDIVLTVALNALEGIIRDYKGRVSIDDMAKIRKVYYILEALQDDNY